MAVEGNSSAKIASLTTPRGYGCKCKRKRTTGFWVRLVKKRSPAAQLAAVRQKLNTLGNLDRKIISYSSKFIGG
jgi:hypothetical protein